MFLQILFLITMAAFAIYMRAKRRNAYWRKRGIPGPEPVPFKGNIDLLFGTRPGILQLQEWTKQFGPVYGVQYGWHNALVTSDPKMVHQVIVEKFEHFYGRMLPFNPDTLPDVDMFLAKGKRWKRLRSIANPAFTVTSMKRVMPLMDDSIQKMVELLTEKMTSGDPIVNIGPYFNEMALDVICRVAFGQQGSRQFRNEYTQLARDAFQHFGNNAFEYYTWQFPWLGERLIMPFEKITGLLRRSPIETIMSKVAKVVEERKRQKEMGDGGDGTTTEYDEEGEEPRHADFIDIFLETETQKCALESQNGCFNKTSAKFEKTMTIDEIVKSCFLFLLAGFDTTSNTLTLISHNLALYPAVQDKMFEEIDSVCVDETPNFEQLNRLKYTEAVLKETLRVCPITAAAVTRVCEETTTVGDYTLEKGTAVMPDIFTLHRNKEVWGPDADQFRPERWLDSNVPINHFYAFGGGPRICIGQRFGILEAKMALCHLLRRFRLVQCVQTEKDMAALQFTGQVVMNPKSVTLRLVPRA